MPAACSGAGPGAAASRPFPARAIGTARTRGLRPRPRTALTPSAHRAGPPARLLRTVTAAPARAGGPGGAIAPSLLRASAICSH